MRKVKDTPIASQEEADETREYLIKETAETLKITREDATQRVDALFASGLLKKINPLTAFGQFQIDSFMRNPPKP